MLSDKSPTRAGKLSGTNDHAQSFDDVMHRDARSDTGALSRTTMKHICEVC